MRLLSPSFLMGIETDPFCQPSGDRHVGSSFARALKPWKWNRAAQLFAGLDKATERVGQITQDTAFSFMTDTGYRSMNEHCRVQFEPDLEPDALYRTEN